MSFLDNFSEEKIKEYIPVLKKRWKFILLWGTVGAVAGVALSFSSPKTYTVVSKVTPELTSRSGNLSSLASLAGINMSMLSNSNDALIPTVYPEIIGSVPFVTDLFDMPVADSTLYDYMLNGTRHSWFGAVVSLPFKALSALTGLFRQKDSLETATLDIYRLTQTQQKVYRALCQAIEVTVDKRTYLVTIRVSSQNPVIAADLSSAIIGNLRKYVTRYRTDKVRKDAAYLSRMYETAKKEYMEAHSAYAHYLDSHQEMSRHAAQVEKQYLYNESQLKYQLYMSVSQQLQQAEMLVQKEAPVFVEIVPPSVPLRKSAPSRFNWMFAFMLLSVAIASGVIITKDIKSSR